MRRDSRVDIWSNRPFIRDFSSRMSLLEEDEGRGWEGEGHDSECESLPTGVGEGRFCLVAWA